MAAIMPPRPRRITNMKVVKPAIAWNLAPPLNYLG
jgi:hypothetical protein